MSFSCTPYELVSFVLEKLSFSGQFGLPLSELWSIIQRKLKSDNLDDFQKQTIWQWLFFCLEEDEQLQLYITRNSVTVSILPNYSNFIKTEGEEESLRVLPTPDAQCYYLTGVADNKKFRQSLGEMSFQLLCEIAKYGADGVYSPNLCKATGQDPRSLPVRFRKLEEMGLIVRKNVYNSKTRQHTNLTMHSKFAMFSENERNVEDAKGSAAKLKPRIVQAVKEAPNQIRSFRDLRAELKMDINRTVTRYFGTLIESLESGGYVERVNAKGPNDTRLLYSIKYVKDLPKNTAEIADYVDVFNTTTTRYDADDDDDNKEIEQVENVPPSINKFFPVPNQLFRAIEMSGNQGIALKVFLQSICGNHHKTMTRLLEALVSYTFDGKSLVPFKNFEDECNRTSIVRAYDFEGKFKFYRYFARGNHPPTDVKPHKHQRPKLKMIHSTIEKINGTLNIPLGNIPKGPLMAKFQKGEAVPKATPSHKEKVEENEWKETEDVESAESDENFESDEGELNEEPASPIGIDDIEPIIPRFEVRPIRKSSGRGISAETIKGTKRRAELLSLIKSLGGVAYATASLIKMLDERLSSTTRTDTKTLARDVSLLVESKDLETKLFHVMKNGQPTAKTLLIITEEGYRPSKEKIEKAKEDFLKENGLNYPPTLKPKRIVESEVTFYKIPAPAKKKESKRRLASLDERVTSAPLVRKKPTVVNETTTPSLSDIEEQEPEQEQEQEEKLTDLVSKRHRRKAKPGKKKVDGTKSRTPRGFRSTSKFDKSDATTLFRAVCISKCFSKGPINFPSIANLFEGMDAKSCKQKWTIVRKSVGGLPAVSKGVEEFESIILKAIRDEIVSSKDLEQVQYPFFLDLWRESTSSPIEIEDKTPLFYSVDDNLQRYNRVISIDVQQDLFDQMEDNSMRQKELRLIGAPFFYSDDYSFNVKPHDAIRTALKAIFSTAEENFSASAVNKLLAEHGDDLTKEASSALIKEKEMIYYGSDDTNSRFMLTDRVFNCLVVRMSPSFLQQASRFWDNLFSIIESSKGLILSQGILSGEMAQLMQLISSDVVSLAHIDKTYTFDGYESRLINKDKLICDIVVYGDQKSNLSSDYPHENKVPVPAGKAGSHIWLGLDGAINETLWIKIIVAVLHHIHTRPGIPGHIIYNKLQSTLGYNDFQAVIDWLIASKCIYAGDCSGYWLSDPWLSILGS
ncbi:RNA polymerase III transcription factor [Spathaspora passalidarum NRRL Y-27907]|uniref:RNA polymerase III transcription factor n=1 Tax=Spathaspora passalidarum (strain NRRL Y-27907 / 11-Y1) TaxID=619300 RepID=G3AE62_SPAPN|nr:RNA polymerase III transcription factor [Spathaspora passalidarum NRRL Y-27907]EGW35596.1 RNA polymerase III transcription factor [Spathaspora passalidarum NRRL Y-27907]